jgi:UDP-N-acetylmuramate: L-alanyl-gamma-D-glutamyl-meso-diaminopimelate ligase
VPIVTPNSDRPRVDLAQVRHVHLVAIAGVAMAALAGMLRQRGLRVTGSDEKIYPPMSTLLERLGIPVLEGYRAENLQPRPDLVVIGNKVSRPNPEVQAVLASGLPYLSLPEALAEFFLASRRPLVVTGTHGKTTSTAMLAWMLEQAGRDPSVMVGGESLDFGGNFKLGGGEFFVIEGDEYDSAFFDKGPKFLHYRPAAAILTAVEFDHADIYRDLEAVKLAFRRFVALLPSAAPLVVAQDFPHAVEIAADATQAKVSSFGTSEAAEWRIHGLRDVASHTAFDVRHRGKVEGEIRLKVPGRINALNALGVYVLGRALGMSHDEIAPGLANFSGVARRQEVVGDFGGATLIDDFAHHPTAVSGTLAAMRQRYPSRRLWALFEPRSNTSRRRVFQRDYVQALAAADLVVLAEVFHKETDQVAESELFSSAQLVDDLRRGGHAARCLDSSDAIAALVAAEAKPGDVVVMMSNGDFGGLRRKLAAAMPKAQG